MEIPVLFFAADPIFLLLNIFAFIVHLTAGEDRTIPAAKSVWFRLVCSFPTCIVHCAIPSTMYGTPPEAVVFKLRHSDAPSGRVLPVSP